jgi:hypothetical protein
MEAVNVDRPVNMKDCAKSAASGLMKAASWFVALAVTASCDSDPGEKFSSKEQIGECHADQGMVVFDAGLYSDSTFYIAAQKPYIGYAFGRFRINKDTLVFITEGGEKHLCEKYLYNRAANRLEPLRCRYGNNESLQIFFGKDDR